MIPVHLYNGCLRSALGETLASASSLYLAGQRAPAARYRLNELGEERCYYAAAASARTIEEELTVLVGDCLGDDSAELGDCVLIIASTTLDIARMEARVAAGEPFSEEISTSLARMADELRSNWGFAAAYTLNTACTSAANALLYGARLIGQGGYRRALIIAFETPCELAMQGFAALGLVSPSGLYRPFHPDRDGLILGEAYSAVMLSCEAPAEPLAKLLGGFSACDTSNLTTTREDGSHIHWVMQRALKSAGLKASQIDLVKPHGTATGANDNAEANGMRLTFTDRLPPSCLLKPYLGHTLGACGLSETLLLLDALRRGPLPAVDYAEQAVLPLIAAPLAIADDALLLSNFFGFGGNNASLVLQRGPACT